MQMSKREKKTVWRSTQTFRDLQLIRRRLATYEMNLPAKEYFIKRERELHNKLRALMSNLVFNGPTP